MIFTEGLYKKLLYGENVYDIKFIMEVSFQYSSWKDLGDQYFFKVTVERRKGKAMAPHSSTLAWEIPWVEEPGRLQSMGSLRVRHD